MSTCNDDRMPDVRLIMQRSIEEIRNSITRLQLVLAETADKNQNVIIPPFVLRHRSQPLLFSNVMQAFIELLQRDYRRFSRVHALITGSALDVCLSRSAQSDAALAVRKLGLLSVFGNAIETVTDWEILSEFMFAGSAMAIHLSELAETLTYWSTSDLEFVQFCDEDIGKTGNVSAALAMVDRSAANVAARLAQAIKKSQAVSIGHNRNLEPARDSINDAVNGITLSLSVMWVAIRSLKLNCDPPKIRRSITSSTSADTLPSSKDPIGQASIPQSASVKSSTSTGVTDQAGSA